MTEISRGFTGAGIRWEVLDSTPDPKCIIAIVALTPQRPETDNRFTVHHYGPGKSLVTDGNDPDNPLRYEGLHRARQEAESLIRAEWAGSGRMGISWPVRFKGDPSRDTEPNGTVSFPEGMDMPVMDGPAFVLLYAMHLCAVLFENGGNETIEGALTEACRAWSHWRQTGAPAIEMSTVWPIVNEAWEQECREWWPTVPMTLKEFDESADRERSLVLRCAFNRHTGIHETFRFV